MQVTFLGPIQSVKGSLDKNSGAYFTTRNGKTYLCFRRQSQTDKAAANKAPAPKQASIQQRFTRMQIMTNEIMHSPELKALYNIRFRRQHKYPTLRGFICHQVSLMLKQSNL